jgi:hypothetical protein
VGGQAIVLSTFTMPHPAQGDIAAFERLTDTIAFDQQPT